MANREQRSNKEKKKPKQDKDKDKPKGPPSSPFADAKSGKPAPAGKK